MPVSWVRKVAVAAVFSVAVAILVPTAAAGADARSEAVPLGRPGCRLIAVPTALPLGVGGGSCPGVRPGALVRTPIGVCTMNFVFRGSDGSSYIGTAGHCILGGTGVEEVSLPAGQGPVARDAQGRPIGRFAYAALGSSRDFALIRLDRGVVADPQVCHFGGPLRLADGPLSPLAGLRQVGQSRLFGDLLPGRPQLALSVEPDVVLGVGVAAPGDSGGPLTTSDGGAAGVVVATGPTALGLGTGLVYSTRLTPQLARASQITGVRYDLQTAPLL